MNRFKCLLTGGHEYRDEFLKVFRDNINDEFIFKNYCIKCHKPIVTKEIPFRNIIPYWVEGGRQHDRD